MAYKTRYDPVFSYFATIYLSISNCLFTRFCYWPFPHSLNGLTVFELLEQSQVQDTYHFSRKGFPVSQSELVSL